MSDTWALHRVLVRTSAGIYEACRRLREHGYDPDVGWSQADTYYGTPITFLAPHDEELGFLRPDILPPTERPAA